MAVAGEQLADHRLDLVVGNRDAQAEQFGGVAKPSEVLAQHERLAAQRLEQVEDCVAAQKSRIERRDRGRCRRYDRAVEIDVLTAQAHRVSSSVRL